MARLSSCTLSCLRAYILTVSLDALILPEPCAAGDDICSKISGEPAEIAEESLSLLQRSASLRVTRGSAHDAAAHLRAARDIGKRSSNQRGTSRSKLKGSEKHNPQTFNKYEGSAQSQIFLNDTIVPVGFETPSIIAKRNGQVEYLIASFPGVKAVAYTMPPDNVFRPLYIGNVTKPTAVCTDTIRGRLYVADPERKKIFLYKLIIQSNGFLRTTGSQDVAVDEVKADWMTVNAAGDLYFTGHPTYKPPTSSFQSQRALFRMNHTKIAAGDPLNPTMVLDRPNSGWPNSVAFFPTGVAVDSFNVYWGNGKNGKKHGAIVSTTHQNIGLPRGSLEVNVVSKANNEVRAVAVTEMDVFYITPEAIYGVDKTAWGTVEYNPKVNVVQNLPKEADGVPWNPVAMAFDGIGTMYWTDAKAGGIYSFPCMDTNPHPIHKYVNAPKVHGLASYTLVDIPRARLAGRVGVTRIIEAQVAAQPSARSENDGEAWLPGGGAACRRPHLFLAATLFAALVAF